jgi:anti-anti-sigma regulatory factor
MRPLPRHPQSPSIHKEFRCAPVVLRNSPRSRRGPILPSKIYRERNYFLEVETVGEIAVVRFTCRQILSEGMIEIIARQLSGLVEQEGFRKIVLNFERLDRMATAILGKLIRLHLKLRVLGGWLVFCKIPRHLYEIFSILRLPRVLAIFVAEPEALQMFKPRYHVSAG